MVPCRSTKQLCTARVARYSGRPALMAAASVSSHSGCSSICGTVRSGGSSTGLLAACSTSCAEVIQPSVSSRPSASCGSSSGVHTTRKAGCSLT